MKRYIIKFLGVLGLMGLCFVSCREQVVENLIPDDAPRMSDIQRQYQDELVANEAGWFIEYKPDENSPSVPIFMRFFADGTVEIISDRLNFSEEKQSTYRIGGVIGPELIFDTYSVWSAVAETGGGAFEFRMSPQENGDFILRHATGGNENQFILRKAGTHDRENIRARAAVGRLLDEFSRQSGAYFRSLVLQQVSAFWELNTETQQVALTWKDPAGNDRSETRSYSTLPGNGIRFAQPWRPNGLEISDIYFGDASEFALEIVSAGNAGSGRIEVGHTPAFPYPGMADLYMFSNSLRINQDPVRFLGYTLDSTRISPALRPYYNAVTNALPSFWRVQVYNYNPVTAPRNAIVLVGRDAAGANTFHYFYYQMTKMDESHVGLRYEDANTLGATLVDHPDVRAFLDRIYPPEGVTVVPIGINQRLRVVSRANSNYWIDLTISTPTNALP